MTTTHPSEEVLELYANGSLSAGMDIFVNGHLHFCPTCREKVELLEIVAGELLVEDGVEAAAWDFCDVAGRVLVFQTQ